MPRNPPRCRQVVPGVRPNQCVLEETTAVQCDSVHHMHAAHYWCVTFRRCYIGCAQTCCKDHGCCMYVDWLARHSMVQILYYDVFIGYRSHIARGFNPWFSRRFQQGEDGQSQPAYRTLCYKGGNRGLRIAHGNLRLSGLCICCTLFAPQESRRAGGSGATRFRRMEDDVAVTVISLG